MTVEELSAIVADKTEEISRLQEELNTLKAEHEATQNALSQSRETNERLIRLIPNNTPEQEVESEEPEKTQDELIREYLGIGDKK